MYNFIYTKPTVTSKCNTENFFFNIGRYIPQNSLWTEIFKFVYEKKEIPNEINQTILYWLTKNKDECYKFI